MPKTVMIKIEVDNKVKKYANKLFKELGLDIKKRTTFIMGSRQKLLILDM